MNEQQYPKQRFLAFTTKIGLRNILQNNWTPRFVKTMVYFTNYGMFHKSKATGSSKSSVHFIESFKSVS